MSSRGPFVYRHGFLYPKLECQVCTAIPSFYMDAGGLNLVLTLGQQAFHQLSHLSSCSTGCTSRLPACGQFYSTELSFMHKIILKCCIKSPLGHTCNAYTKHTNFVFLFGFQLKDFKDFNSLHTQIGNTSASSAPNVGNLTCIKTLFSYDLGVCRGNCRESMIGLT